MLKLWDKLNNKKTSIGAGMLLSAMVVEQMVGIWAGAAHPEWIPKVVHSLEWLGGVVAGVGLGHKGVKQMKRETSQPR